MILEVALLWVSVASAQPAPPCAEEQLAQERERPRGECRGPTGPEPRSAVAEIPDSSQRPAPSWLRAALPEGCINTEVGEGVPWVNLRPASRCLGEWRFASLQWPSRERTLTLRNGQRCVGRRARRFELTWEDVVWIARMLEGEAEAEVAVAGSSRRSPQTRALAEQHLAGLLWTIAKRQVHARDHRDHPSFAAYLQEFSQPINPDFLVPGRAGCVRRPHQCTPTLIARRQAIRSKPWEELPESARRIALQFALGLLADPYPRSVNFAAVPRGRDGSFLRPDCPAGEQVMPMDDHGRAASEVGGVGRTFFCEPVRAEAPLITMEPPVWLSCAPTSVPDASQREIQRNLQPPPRECTVR